MSEQADYIWDNGTYLASRTEEPNGINLYHLRSYFVEVWFDSYLLKITNIRTFTSKRYLDDYTHDIEVEKMLNEGMDNSITY